MNKHPALKPARVGNLYDLNHAAVQEWLAGRGFDLDDLEDVAIQAPRAADVVSSELKAGQADISLGTVSGLTLGQITEQIGTPHEALVWVKVRKELAVARRQEWLQARVRGLLIPAQVVEWLFGHLDALTVRLIGDAGTTLVRRLMSHGRAGGTLEEGKMLFDDAILAQVRLAIDTLKRTVAGIDKVSALQEKSPPKRNDEVSSASALRALKNLEHLLCEQAAPTIFDLTTKQFALNPPPSAESAVRAIGNIMRAYVARAVRACDGKDERGPKTNQE